MYLFWLGPDRNDEPLHNLIREPPSTDSLLNYFQGFFGIFIGQESDEMAGIEGGTGLVDEIGTHMITNKLALMYNISIFFKCFIFSIKLGSA